MKRLVVLFGLAACTPPPQGPGFASLGLPDPVDVPAPVTLASPPPAPPPAPAPVAVAAAAPTPAIAPAPAPAVAQEAVAAPIAGPSTAAPTAPSPEPSPVAVTPVADPAPEPPQDSPTLVPAPASDGPVTLSDAMADFLAGCVETASAPDTAPDAFRGLGYLDAGTDRRGDLILTGAGARVAISRLLADADLAGSSLGQCTMSLGGVTPNQVEHAIDAALPHVKGAERYGGGAAFRLEGTCMLVVSNAAGDLVRTQPLTGLGDGC